MEVSVDRRPVFSVVGIFESAQLLMDAIPVVKARVDAPLEAYMPYPIHGIDRALGLRKSPIGGMVLTMGVIGAMAGIGLALWTSGIDYPLVTAGKSYFSWQAFVPIMFELTVLFATFTAGLGMLLLLNRLPFFRHPMLGSKSMALITRDKFALAVEAQEDAIDGDQVAGVLWDAGATAIEVIEKPPPLGPLSPKFLLRVAGMIAIACVVAGYLTYWGIKLFPASVPMVHMLDQPRLDPQRESRFFRDGFGMRLPETGTVAHGKTPYPIRNQQDAAAIANPLPRTERVLSQGRQDFMNYCSVCHGVLGNGVPTLTAAYGAKPADLVSGSVAEYTDGKIYDAIMRGKNAMPSYAVELSGDERWATVHFIRVLQRALNARDDDIPKESTK